MVSMHIDMGVRFSMELFAEKFTRENSCTFVGTGIQMPVYPGNSFHEI